MPQYLLTSSSPTATRPPEVLEPVMRELAALNQEMRAAGVWVFAGGPAPAGDRHRRAAPTATTS